METVKKVLLWIGVVVCGLVTLASFRVMFDADSHGELVTAAVMTALFAGITVVMGVKLHGVVRKSASQIRSEDVRQGDTEVPAIASPTDNLFVKAGKWYMGVLTGPFSSTGRQRLRQDARLQSTNILMRTGSIILVITLIVWLVLAVTPIVLTIIEARSAISGDSSAANNVGMVVFAVFLLAPLWGAMVAGWLALPALICFLVGLGQAQWKVRPQEYGHVVVAALLVIVAVLGVANLSEIMPFYQKWFLPWTL
jgi:hypothetical protein